MKVVAYGVVGLVSAMLTVGLLWPFGPLVALVCAPFGATLGAAVLAGWFIVRPIAQDRREPSTERQATGQNWPPGSRGLNNKVG
jgi:hypothetical protein